jgi:hypothetical protein
MRENIGGSFLYSTNDILKYREVGNGAIYNSHELTMKYARVRTVLNVYGNGMVIDTLIVLVNDYKHIHIVNARVQHSAKVYRHGKAPFKHPRTHNRYIQRLVSITVYYFATVRTLARLERRLFAKNMSKKIGGGFLYTDNNVLQQSEVQKRGIYNLHKLTVKHIGTGTMLNVYGNNMVAIMITVFVYGHNHIYIVETRTQYSTKIHHGKGSFHTHIAMRIPLIPPNPLLRGRNTTNNQSTYRDYSRTVTVIQRILHTRCRDTVSTTPSETLTPVRASDSPNPPTQGGDSRTVRDIDDFVSRSGL